MNEVDKDTFSLEIYMKYHVSEVSKLSPELQSAWCKGQWLWQQKANTRTNRSE